MFSLAKIMKPVLGLAGWADDAVGGCWNLLPPMKPALCL